MFGQPVFWIAYPSTLYSIYQHNYSLFSQLLHYHILFLPDPGSCLIRLKFRITNIAIGRRLEIIICWLHYATYGIYLRNRTHPLHGSVAARSCSLVDQWWIRRNLNPFLILLSDLDLFKYTLYKHTAIYTLSFIPDIEYVMNESIKIHELTFSSFLIPIQSGMFFDYFFRDRVIPLPLKIHRLSLLFCHQVNFEIFVFNQCPFLVFASRHLGCDCIDSFGHFVSF